MRKKKKKRVEVSKTTYKSQPMKGTNVMKNRLRSDEDSRNKNFKIADQEEIMMKNTEKLSNERTDMMQLAGMDKGKTMEKIAEIYERTFLEELPDIYGYKEEMDAKKVERKENMDTEKNDKGLAELYTKTVERAKKDAMRWVKKAMIGGYLDDDPKNGMIRSFALYAAELLIGRKLRNTEAVRLDKKVKDITDVPKNIMVLETGHSMVEKAAKIYENAFLESLPDVCGYKEDAVKRKDEEEVMDKVEEDFGLKEYYMKVKERAKRDMKVWMIKASINGFSNSDLKEGMIQSFTLFAAELMIGRKLKSTEIVRLERKVEDIVDVPKNILILKAME